MDMTPLTGWFDALSTFERRAVIALALAVLIPVGLAWGRWNSRRKLEHWAKAEGLQLISWRGEPAWRGPRAWIRRDNHDDYEVVVIDRSGITREGHLMFTGPWHGFGPEDVDVQWEET